MNFWNDDSIFYLLLPYSTFVGSAWSFVFFIPATTAIMTSDFEGFSIPDFIHYIYFPILILDKEPVFSFWMFSAKRGNFFITSLIWRGPWLGIELGTSRTRSQHSTTRLSRRLYDSIKVSILNLTHFFHSSCKFIIVRHYTCIIINYRKCIQCRWGHSTQCQSSGS